VVNDWYDREQQAAVVWSRAIRPARPGHVCTLYQTSETPVPSSDRLGHA
jgi:hypothetical protein